MRLYILDAVFYWFVRCYAWWTSYSCGPSSPLMWDNESAATLNWSITGLRTNTSFVRWHTLEKSARRIFDQILQYRTYKNDPIRPAATHRRVTGCESLDKCQSGRGNARGRIIKSSNMTSERPARRLKESISRFWVNTGQRSPPRLLCVRGEGRGALSCQRHC